MKICICTSVFITGSERLEYFKNTINSFYECCITDFDIEHFIINDRSDLLYDKEIEDFCILKGLFYLGRTEENRETFKDAFMLLLNSVDTEYFVYLEPDHHFYLKYKFVEPIIRLFELRKDLCQVFLRTPITYKKFELIGENLVTYDKTKLSKIVIDTDNVGWVGKGGGHETFSLMPSFIKTSVLMDTLNKINCGSSVKDFEVNVARAWKYQKLIGYLNSQAFCYHIGKVDKAGPGGFLNVGDERYEKIWSEKIL